MSNEAIQETSTSAEDDSATSTTTTTNKPTTRTSTSTLLSADEVAKRVGVAPTDSKATRRQRLRAYWWFKKLLTISQFFDPIQIPNSYVNYQCIWWKAISGNDRNSPLYDTSGGLLYYDLLPPVTRLAVATPLATYFYPRFHHANVELRTYYLDTVMEQIVKSSIPLPSSNDNDTTTMKQQHTTIRLVLFGCGYDLRSLRMALRYQEQQGYRMEFIELDLPHVIEAKQLLFQQRLVRRRPDLKELISQIQMFGVDLNDIDQVESILKSQLTANDIATPSITIFVFEAILVYLDEGIPSKILTVLSEILRGRSGPSSGSGVATTAAICFADTLENIKSNQESEAREELKKYGWDLQDWITKPGKTNHLGWATLLSDSD